jgi:hypothetical protein
MATSLADFLGRLAQDPELLASFQADKTATMNEHGVSDEHQKALLSGDPDKIHAALGGELMKDQELDMQTFM